MAAINLPGMIDPNMCGRSGCTERATHRGFARLSTGSGRPADTAEFISVCTEHKDAHLDEVVTEVGWNMICASAVRGGFGIPKKKFSKLIFRRIENGREQTKK